MNSQICSLKIDKFEYIGQNLKIMKKHLLILCLSIFLIGNYHVATDWCGDLGAEETVSAPQAPSQHDSGRDLCGHCGHLGLNILFLNMPDMTHFEEMNSTKPLAEVTQFVSILSAPPLPPPVILA